MALRSRSMQELTDANGDAEPLLEDIPAIQGHPDRVAFLMPERNPHWPN